MSLVFPEFEKERYKSILNKDIEWLDYNLDDEYTHIHSNGVIENKEIYLKNIASDNITFKEMCPINYSIREKDSFIFITGISNFKLIYFKNFLDLKLAYHSIWQKGVKPKYYSWQATKVSF